MAGIAWERRHHNACTDEARTLPFLSPFVRVTLASVRGLRLIISQETLLLLIQMPS